MSTNPGSEQQKEMLWARKRENSVHY